MKFKIRNTILLILHTIASVLLFLPGMYVNVIYKMGENIDRIVFEEEMSFFKLIDGWSYYEWSEPIAILIFILFLIVFLALLLQMVGKRNQQKNSIAALILTIVNYLTFFWYSFFLSKIEITWDSQKLHIELGSMYFWELLVQIVLIVIFVITFVQNSESTQKEVQK